MHILTGIYLIQHCKQSIIWDLLGFIGRHFNALYKNGQQHKQQVFGSLGIKWHYCMISLAFIGIHTYVWYQHTYIFHTWWDFIIKFSHTNSANGFILLVHLDFISVSISHHRSHKDLYMSVQILYFSSRLFISKRVYI